VKNSILGILLFVCCLPIWNGCGQASFTGPSDSPTSGNILVIADESYKPIMDTQAFVFTSLYKKAHVKLAYYPQEEAYRRLLRDTVRFIVVGREPNAYEKSVFDSLRIKPRITTLAVEGVALVVHPDFPDSTLSIDDLKTIVRTEGIKWSDLEKKNPSVPIKLVFDNSRSVNAGFLHEVLMKEEKNAGFNCFALDSNAQVIDYVQKHPGTIGAISVNWISDRDDPSVEKFLKKVKLMGVAEADGMEYYRPYQAYLALNKYPLTRKMLAVSREPRAGLGTGFVSFMAGEKGQRMMLKSGMVPVQAPVRLIKTN
jgi:phosphate transport system substrate-binding protein